MSDKNRRGGLGRGLGALIPTAPPAAVPASTAVPAAPAAEHPASPTGGRAEQRTAPAGSADGEQRAADSGATQRHAARDDLRPVEGAHFAELPIETIHPNAKQPRQVFDEDALAELTHSVREFGVLQPVVVRADTESPDGGYELVMGERRLRAASAAGLTSIPAIVRSTADDAMLRDALLENIHRAQLNPLEEAAAYQQLLEEFGTTHDELAQRIGRSRPQVTNTIRLLNLSVPVQRRVAAGVLSAGHARALLALQDGQTQDDLAGRIVAEGLSVRATEELVALHNGGHTGRKPARQAHKQKITAPGLSELAGKLSDAFETRVRVELGRRKGKITVEFASIDDLERIVAVMAPEVAPTRGSGDGPAAQDGAAPNRP